MESMQAGATTVIAVAIDGRLAALLSGRRHS
jgi:hypothetical protein